MSEYPITFQQIKSLKWRNELNRILLDFKPTNGERVFLACFLKDKCNFSEIETTELILKYAKWTNLDPKKTTRHVNMIYEKFQGSKYPVPNETHTRETHRGQNVNKTYGETNGGATAIVYDYEKSGVASHVFRVSPMHGIPEQETNMSQNYRDERGPPPETIRSYPPVVCGSRYFRIVEKEGNRGPFYSLESGWMNDTEYEGKTIVVPTRADKYFTLPLGSNPDLLNQLQATFNPNGDNGGSSKKKK